MALRSMVDEILDERKRQQEDEGFSTQHDDRYRNGELVKAAICFAAMGIGIPEVLIKIGINSAIKEAWVNPWPWELHWDKRNKHSKNKCLVVAAALILAEMERRSRAGETMI